MGFRTALLLALILASGCAGPYVLDDDNAAVVTPLEIGDRGHIFVQATINGLGPFRFALDTGASISVIFDRTREQAGLELVEDKQIVIQGMVSAGSFPLARIAELRIGNESWTNARVASLPTDSAAYEQMDGILGIDFLRRYAVGVSTRDRVVRLYAPQLVSKRSYRGWASVPMQQIEIGTGDATAYTIGLNINGVEIPTLLDLGTGSNLMNWHTATTIQVRLRPSERGTTLSGAVETVPVVAQLEVEQLSIGETSWNDRIFLISDFPIFGALGLDDDLVAIVGPRLFGERDFVIDFERQRLLVAAAR